MMLVTSSVWSRPSRCPISCSAMARMASSSRMGPPRWCTASTMSALMIHQLLSRSHLVRPLIASSNWSMKVTCTSARAESSAKAKRTGRREVVPCGEGVADALDVGLGPVLDGARRLDPDGERARRRGRASARARCRARRASRRCRCLAALGETPPHLGLQPLALHGAGRQRLRHHAAARHARPHAPRDAEPPRAAGGRAPGRRGVRRRGRRGIIVGVAAARWRERRGRSRPRRRSALALPRRACGRRPGGGRDARAAAARRARERRPRGARPVHHE